MKANTGIDYQEFLQLLWTIAKPRLHAVQQCGTGASLVGVSKSKCKETDRESLGESSSDTAPRTDCEHGTHSAEEHYATWDQRTQRNPTDPSDPSLLPADAHGQNPEEQSHRWHLVFDLCRIREVLADDRRQRFRPA